MRWFAAVAIIVLLAALDRAYMDGENATLLMSGAQHMARVVNDG